MVTDPYSVALTLNSTRSVAVDLERPGVSSPRSGDGTPQPALTRASTRRSTSCTCGTSRSATRPCRPRSAARTWRSPTTATARSTCGRSRRPASTRCTCCRRSTSRRSRRTARRSSTPACDLASFAPDSDQQQACVDGGRRHRRLQLGLRPVPLARRPRAPTPDRRTAARGSREFRDDGRRPAPRRPAGRAGPGLQPHPGGRAGADSRCSTRSCPATTSGWTRPARSRPRPAARTSPPSTRWREKLMVDSVVHVGARLQGRRLPVRPDGPPLARRNMLAVRAALDELTPAQGRRRRQDDLPVRRGLELRRGGRQRAVRAGHPGPARRHRHRDVHRPAARRRARRRPVRRRTRACRASAPVGDRPERRPGQRHGRRPAARLGARHRPGAARAGRQPARLHASSTATGATVAGRRGRLQRSAGRLRRPAGRGRSATSTPTTTRRCSTR